MDALKFNKEVSKALDSKAGREDYTKKLLVMIEELISGYLSGVFEEVEDNAELAKEVESNLDKGSKKILSRVDFLIERWSVEFGDIK